MPNHPLYREAFEYRFSSLDPHSAHVDPPAVAVYETLLTRGPDGRPRPRLARSWNVSENGLTWDLELRANAEFHSGSPCDADAVVKALDALRWDMHVLPGGRQLWYWDPVDRVEALDSHTVRIHLHYPYSRLYTLLWGTHTAIHNESLRQVDPSGFGIERADGTGPYRLTAWSPERIETARVDDGSRSIQHAAWVSLPNSRDRYSALLAGDVDCAHALDADAVAELHTDSRFVQCRQAQPSSMYLTVDWNRKELGFHERDLRHALSLAIDRPRLVRVALGGLGTPAWGPIPPTHEFYDETVDERGELDRERATALLESLGWTLGTGGVRQRQGVSLAFDCLVQKDDTFKVVAELVAEDLQDIGVSVRIRYAEPFADFYAEVQKVPAAAISKWLWPDPVEALKGFCSTSTAPFPNWEHASVARLDASFESFLRVHDVRELQRAASLVQSVFAEELPYIPLLTPDDVWAWRSNLVGFQPRHGDLYPLYDHVNWKPSH